MCILCRNFNANFINNAPHSIGDISACLQTTNWHSYLIVSVDSLCTSSQLSHYITTFRICAVYFLTYYALSKHLGQ